MNPIKIKLKVDKEKFKKKLGIKDVGDIYQVSSRKASWGEIQGTLSNQTDLQSALDAKLGETFESISKNLKSYPCTFNKTGDVLDSITYTLPSGTITKTFNRTGTVLNTVVLSGDTPAGIDLTKTFNYTGSVLTSIAYS